MSKFDDLTAAVTDLQAALTDNLAAIDKEIQQLADAIANGSVPASLQTNIDNLTAAAAAIRAASTKLAGDDTPTV